MRTGSLRRPTLIEFRKDNLLEADAEALVNSVNTVGVMGKGVALQFKKTFDENFKKYARACKKGEVKIGKMYTVDLGTLDNPRYIINFPTKQHWREKSRLEYIQAGLEDLIQEVELLDIGSVAVPPLGCGNGGLDWDIVRPLIEQAFAKVPDTQVLIYEPRSAPGPTPIKVTTSKPKLTVARALMIKLAELYGVAGYSLGRLEAQKLAYFLQVAGEPSLKLSFDKSHYGPYAEKLNFLLQTLEGHYTTGYGDRTVKSRIKLLPQAKEEAEAFLQEHPEAKERLKEVAQLIEGFETPYGMELLATVHWVASQEKAADFTTVLKEIQSWSTRKGDLFSREHVNVAWRHLVDEDWIPSDPVLAY